MKISDNDKKLMLYVGGGVAAYFLLIKPLLQKLGIVKTKDEVEEEILDFLKSRATNYKDYKGNQKSYVPDDDYEYIADKILTLIHPNRDSQPNGSKPLVSGSLPGWAAELLTEVRFRLLVDIDQDGEPRSSMAELLEMWDKVNKALNIKTIGQ